MQNSNKPIYPQIGSNTNSQHQLSEVWIDETNQGLSKREYFAGLAMQGMLSNSELLKILFTHLEPKAHCGFLNLSAIEQADDLLKQLEETK